MRSANPADRILFFKLGMKEGHRGSIDYRPEIDGLRAIAVLAVLLFHFEFGLSGGFVGVDVFFVISGYLITGIMLKEMKQNTFSFLQFWTRRIRRILPASIVMVLVSVIAATFLLSPAQYERLTQEAIAQLLFVSNFVFAEHADYFSVGNDSSLLLHTWSLAVEEQFYLLFPFILWGVCRLRNGALWAIILLMIGSFVWGHHALSRDTQAAFYLLTSRGWELLVGSLLAAMQQRNSKKKSEQQRENLFEAGLGILGLVMICVAFFIYDSETPFPGISALLPVVGTALFLIANQRAETITGKWLKNKPLTYIGKISYSLYLWHWPLLIFSQHFIAELTFIHKLALLVLSFLVAIGSWRFIETPLRLKRVESLKGFESKRDTNAVILSSVLVSTMLIISFCLLYKPDASQSGHAKLVLEDVDWTGSEYLADQENLPKKIESPEVATQINIPEIKPAPIGAEGKKQQFILWGDSHAMAVSQTVDRIAKEHNLVGGAFFSVAMQPVTGVFLYRDTAAERADTLGFSEAVLQYIIDNDIPNVILVGRWVAACIGFNAAEMEGCKPLFRFAPMLVDQVGAFPSNELSTAVLKKRLREMCERFDEAGVKVWITRQAPETIHLDTAQRFANFQRFPTANEFSPWTVTLDEHEKRRGVINSVFEDLTAEVLDPTESFFRENGRLRIYADRAYYRDDDHLTRAGADYYLSPLFEKVFSEISQ